MANTRKCIFCGGDGLTKEHVLGKWVSKLVAIPPQGTRVYIDGESLMDGQLIRHQRRYPKNIDLQVRCVCKPCNIGWMAKMEEEVKPIIEILIRTQSYTITEPDQRLLSIWAIKTAITASYLQGGGESPESYRKWFFKHQDVPPNTFVWIGMYEDYLTASVQTKDIRFIDFDANAFSFPHSQFAVITTGKVVFCVLMTYMKNFTYVAKEGLIEDHFAILSPFEEDVIWPRNPFDEPVRQAIFHSSWDDHILMRLRNDYTPPIQ